MLIDTINFLHVITITTLFGLALCAWFNTIRIGLIFETAQQHLRIDYILLSLMLIAGISGAILVKPKGFTVTTPWIRAAYEFLSLSFILLLVQVALRKFIIKRGMNKPGAIFRSYLIGNYSVLIIIFMIIIQDAVAKQTLWYSISHGI